MTDDDDLAALMNKVHALRASMTEQSKALDEIVMEIARVAGQRAARRRKPKLPKLAITK